MSDQPLAIYAWAGDYFCSACLVYEMVQHEPWDKWGAENEVSAYSTHDALERMALHIGINRRSLKEKQDAGYPILLQRANITETIFCCTCLSLLHQVP